MKYVKATLPGRLLAPLIALFMGCSCAASGQTGNAYEGYRLDSANAPFIRLFHAVLDTHRGPWEVDDNTAVGAGANSTINVTCSDRGMLVVFVFGEAAYRNYARPIPFRFTVEGGRHYFDASGEIVNALEDTTAVRMSMAEDEEAIFLGILTQSSGYLTIRDLSGSRDQISLRNARGALEEVGCL